MKEQVGGMVGREGGHFEALWRGFHWVFIVERDAWVGGEKMERSCLGLSRLCFCLSECGSGRYPVRALEGARFWKYAVCEHMWEPVNDQSYLPPAPPSSPSLSPPLSLPSL